MSEKSRVTRSRDHWKSTAVKRGERIRYLGKENKRIAKERDRYKRELKETLAKLDKAQSPAPVIEHKVDLVHLALQLFLVARISFRAVSRVIEVLSGALGISKAPCAQTVINWVIRLSIVRIQSAAQLKGKPSSQDPFSNGLIWMFDISIGLGKEKILSVLALNAHHHQIAKGAPTFQDAHCIAASVADSWTGESIAAFLERLIAVMGRPVAYLKDGGTDLDKAIRLIAERGLGSLPIDDISHVIANLLKWWYGDQPMLETFLSACGRVSGKLKQTVLACLAPPKVRTKARFMNLHRLVTWADRLLKLSPPGGAKAGSILEKLRSCLDDLPQCRAFIRRFRDDAAALLECQKILKAQGLGHDSLKQCRPYIDAIRTVALRDRFQDYLDHMMEIAKMLGLDQIGMPISSDLIESLFGLAKLHGTGKIMDAIRIALRLPALCGPPTREEAQQVLGISVAEQNELIGLYSSLTKQRREVLSNPERLESLGSDQARSHIELIPGTKNRSKNTETLIFPMTCQKAHEPELEC